MRSAVWKSRAIALGLVFAAAGFCLGVSQIEEPSGPQAGNRAVGSLVPFRFTNPLIPFTTDEYDLGDAAFGSTITRYVTAEGGVRPYRFTSFGTASFTNAIEGLRTTLQFGISGVLAGSCPPAQAPFPGQTILGAPGIRFFVRGQDSQGTNPATTTGYFNLTLVDSRGIFRFAVDRVPSARLGDSYTAKLDVIGGNGFLVYSLVSLTNSLGTAVTPKDLGLFLTPDGAIVGRPLVVGSFNMTVRCTDGFRQIARNRANSAQDQTFTITVANNPVTSSDVTTLQCSIRGERNGPGRDTVRYKGLVNVLGQDDFKLLNSEFTFRIAGVSISGRLDQNGRFAGTLRDQSKVNVKVNSGKGSVDVSISKGNFTSGLGFSSTGPTPGLTRLPVQISIGDAVSSTEVLDFETKITGVRYALDYRLGSQGSSAAGSFQLVSVRGKDNTTLSGQLGDSWRAAFVAVPRTAVVDPSGFKQGFDSINSVRVRIGGNFTQTLGSAALRSGGNGINFRGTIADGVRNFSLNTKNFKGKLQTNVLSTRVTNILPASQSPSASNIFFPLGVDLIRTGANAPYTGEHARRIFGFGTQYKDTPPGRYNHR
ncbi:MAG TPA: hypothetical protein VEK08_10940 [Planctomycetota bacterium]|nr:hypothetical protein [Planctomycetota bacterium]